MKSLCGHAAACGKPNAAEPFISASGFEMRSTKWMPAAADAQDGRTAAFTPFSGGPTDCIGQRLAMMQVESSVTRSAIRGNAIWCVRADNRHHNQNPSNIYAIVTCKLLVTEAALLFLKRLTWCIILAITDSAIW